MDARCAGAAEPDVPGIVDRVASMLVRNTASLPLPAPTRWGLVVTGMHTRVSGSAVRTHTVGARSAGARAQSVRSIEERAAPSRAAQPDELADATTVIVCRPSQSLRIDRPWEMLVTDDFVRFCTARGPVTLWTAAST